MVGTIDVTPLRVHRIRHIIFLEKESNSHSNIQVHGTLSSFVRSAYAHPVDQWAIGIVRSVVFE